MITTLIILGILIVFIIGLFQVYKRHSTVVKKIDFASEYRNKFIEFTKIHRSENFEDDKYGELYIWLTMNVNKIQNMVGTFGKMAYHPSFQNYIIQDYQIIINTIPKFRQRQIEEFDVLSVDDCLLRYIGYLQDYTKETQKNLKNPFIWFREGFREILSIPIFILNWFGIISNQAVNSIKDSLIYKIISGLIALVTLLSGIATLILGFDELKEFINRFFYG